MVHKLTGKASQQLKKSYHKAPERKRHCTQSPGAHSPLRNFGSGSSGYMPLLSDSAQAFQEVQSHAEVIASEQLPVASEWVKVWLILCF
jgi:hypothetical protein